ncbi:MAG: cobalt-zinc-cadmium efflux system protein [Kiritimatiellia bacterium]|jgi:cobalt-zinc-cadmium efflux system protein
MGGHDHGGHGHHHGPGGHHHVHVPRGGDPRKALLWALVLNGGFLFIEGGAGWYYGSLALFSDAAHMLSDVAALGLALAAAQLARRRPTSTMTYGLARAEILGAFLNGLGLLAACVWIVYEAVGRLIEGPGHVPGWPVMVVGVIGLGINLGSALALWRSDGDNLNIRAAMAHMLADALGSVGAIIAAGLLLFGVGSADAVVSLLIAALVAWGSWRVLADSGRVLLELPPPGVDVRTVRDCLLAVDGVSEVHDLHVWTLDGIKPLVSAHLVVSAPDALEVCQVAREQLRERFSVDHATLQVERSAVRCELVDCGFVEEAS